MLKSGVFGLIPIVFGLSLQPQGIYKSTDGLPSEPLIVDCGGYEWNRIGGEGGNGDLGNPSFLAEDQINGGFWMGQKACLAICRNPDEQICADDSCCDPGEWDPDSPCAVELAVISGSFGRPLVIGSYDSEDPPTGSTECPLFNWANGMAGIGSDDLPWYVVATGRVPATETPFDDDPESVTTDPTLYCGRVYVARTNGKVRVVVVAATEDILISRSDGVDPLDEDIGIDMLLSKDMCEEMCGNPDCEFCHVDVRPDFLPLEDDTFEFAGGLPSGSIACESTDWDTLGTGTDRDPVYSVATTSTPHLSFRTKVDDGPLICHRRAIIEGDNGFLKLVIAAYEAGATVEDHSITVSTDTCQMVCGNGDCSDCVVSVRFDRGPFVSVETPFEEAVGGGAPAGATACVDFAWDDDTGMPGSGSLDNPHWVLAEPDKGVPCGAIMRVRGWETKEESWLVVAGTIENGNQLMDITLSDDVCSRVCENIDCNDCTMDILTECEDDANALCGMKVELRPEGFPRIFSQATFRGMVVEREDVSTTSSTTTTTEPTTTTTTEPTTTTTTEPTTTTEATTRTTEPTTTRTTEPTEPTTTTTTEPTTTTTTKEETTSTTTTDEESEETTQSEESTQDANTTSSRFISSLPSSTPPDASSLPTISPTRTLPVEPTREPTLSPPLPSLDVPKTDAWRSDARVWPYSPECGVNQNARCPSFFEEVTGPCGATDETPCPARLRGLVEGYNPVCGDILEVEEIRTGNYLHWTNDNLIMYVQVVDYHTPEDHDLWLSPVRTRPVLEIAHQGWERVCPTQCAIAPGHCFKSCPAGEPLEVTNEACTCLDDFGNTPKAGCDGCESKFCSPMPRTFARRNGDIVETETLLRLARRSNVASGAVQIAAATMGLAVLF